MCRICNAKQVLAAKAFLWEGVYKVDNLEKCKFAAQTTTTGETGHIRLDHINSIYLNKMKNGLVEGVDFNVFCLLYEN